MLRFISGIIGYGAAVLLYDAIAKRPTMATRKTAPEPMETATAAADNNGENSPAPTETKEITDILPE